MYFNFKLAENFGFSPEDVVYLQLIKQHKYDKLETILEKCLTDATVSRFENLGLIEYIKGNDKSSNISKIRLSKKGLELLDRIETPDVNDDDFKILDWIVSIYNSENKLIGNKKRIASGIANFRVNTGIEKNNLALLIKTFVNDENEFEYSKKLENLFFNPKNIFQRRFVLEDCRLYEYYLKNKELFDLQFKHNEY